MIGKDVKRLQEFIQKLETLVEEERKLQNEIVEQPQDNEIVVDNEIQNVQ